MNSYAEIIERCYREKLDLVIPNSDHEHASYLIKTFFEKAKEELIIFTGNLYETVYGEEKLRDKAVNFFETRSDGTLRIAFQVEGSKDNILNSKFIKAILSTKPKKGAVTIFDASHIAHEFSNHFTVMDREAFRYELDHTKGTAIANFGAKHVAERLVHVFNKIASDSKLVFTT